MPYKVRCSEDCTTQGPISSCTGAMAEAAPAGTFPLVDREPQQRQPQQGPARSWTGATVEAAPAGTCPFVDQEPWQRQPRQAPARSWTGSHARGSPGSTCTCSAAACPERSEDAGAILEPRSFREPRQAPRTLAQKGTDGCALRFLP